MQIQVNNIDDICMTESVEFWSALWKSSQGYAQHLLLPTDRSTGQAVPVTIISVQRGDLDQVYLPDN